MKLKKTGLSVIVLALLILGSFSSCIDLSPVSKGNDKLSQLLHIIGNQYVDTVDVDGITGATVTSKAIARSVNSAVAFVTGADISSGATSWGG